MTKYHDPLTAGDALKAYVVNTPLQQLDKQATDLRLGNVPASNVDIDGGTTNSTPIGSEVPAPGTFTTLDVTGDLILGSCLKVQAGGLQQSVATVTTDHVLNPVILLDNNDDWDVDTSYWTPSVAGWYMLVAYVHFVALAAAKPFTTSITKNGSVIGTSRMVSEAAVNTNAFPCVTLQHSNGVTDYFGMSFYNGDTGAVALTYTKLMGFRVF